MYNSTIPIAVADRNFHTSPYALDRLLSNHLFAALKAKDHEKFEALERAGFKIDHKGELVHTLYEKLGGHYMDIGCSAKIAKGLVSSHHQERISSLTN